MARHRFIAALALACCWSAGSIQAGTLYLSRLTEANEVPPTGAPYTGLGILILNDAETQATITATHNISIPVTGGHIHRAPVGTNGPIIFPFPAPTSPVGPLTWDNIPAADITNLKTLGLYMNFHTAVNPGGVIRGPLVRALLAPAATNSSQLRVATALDVSAGYSADLNQILVAANTASAAAQAATLDEVSARTVYVQTLQGIEAVGNITDGLLARASSTRGQGSSTTPPTAAFFNFGTGFGDRSNTADQAGSSSSRPFVYGGVAFQLAPNTRGGGAVGYSDARDSFDGGLGKTKGKTTSLHGFISSALGESGIAVDVAAGYGWSKVNASRNLATVGRTAEASPSGHTLSLALKASKSVAFNAGTLVPYFLIDRHECTVDGYTESGANSVALMIPERSTTNSSLEGGVEYLCGQAEGVGRLNLRLQLGWHYLIDDGDDRFATQVAGSPAAFDTVVAGAGKSAAHLQASLGYTLSNGMIAGIGYRGLLGSGGHSIHAVEVSLNLKL